MKYNFLLISSIFLFLFFFSYGVVLYSKDEWENFFPLTKGTYWIYSGIVRWEGNNSEKIEKALTWKMEITDVITCEDITAAIIKGHPLDLVWYKEGKKRGDYLIVKVKNNKYYLLQNRIEEFIQDLKEGKDINDKLNNWNLFLELPLISGKTFAGNDKRNDNCYCWFVQSINDINLTVKGLEIGDNIKNYRLTFQTLPSNIIIDFVSGVGITKYEYVHHGTISEAQVDLVEYCKGDK